MIGQQYDLGLSLFVGATVPTSSRVQAPQSIKVLRFELPSTSKHTSIGFKYNDFNNLTIHQYIRWLFGIGFHFLAASVPLDCSAREVLIEEWISML
jgi:hypothetical protein